MGSGTPQLSSTAGAVNGSSSAASDDSDATFEETVRSTAVHVVLTVLTTSADRSPVSTAATEAEAASASAQTSVAAETASSSSWDAIRSPNAAVEAAARAAAPY